MNTVFSDGEVLVRRRMRNTRFDRDLALPFQIEVVEADYLDTTIQSYGENDVIDGLEFGPTGRVEAYHLYREHPHGLRPWRAGRLQSERVNAADVLHVFRQDRPDQSRGTPWLAAVMLSLGEMSDYQEAQILKQRMAALLAGVVTAEDDTEPWEGAGLQELAPGALVGLESGHKVEWTDPPQVETYDDFMRSALQAIAMGIGVTYEALSGDLRRVNFSSGRMGRMEMDRLVEQWQHFIMIAQFCEGVGRWFDEAFRLRSAPVDYRLKWTAPRRPLIEPNREIPAMIDEVEAGLTSLQRQQRRLGYDPAEIARERAEDEASGNTLGRTKSNARDGATDTDQEDEEGDGDARK